MKRLALMYLLFIIIALYLHGNIIFPGRGVCLGWADDNTPSWICIP